MIGKAQSQVQHLSRSRPVPGANRVQEVRGPAKVLWAQAQILILAVMDQHLLGRGGVNQFHDDVILLATKLFQSGFSLQTFTSAALN
jgi:hypothetical protein